MTNFFVILDILYVKFLVILDFSAIRFDLDESWYGKKDNNIKKKFNGRT